MFAFSLSFWAHSKVTHLQSWLVLWLRSSRWVQVTYTLLKLEIAQRSFFSSRTSSRTPLYECTVDSLSGLNCAGHLYRLQKIHLRKARNLNAKGQLALLFKTVFFFLNIAQSSKEVSNLRASRGVWWEERYTSN